MPEPTFLPPILGGSTGFNNYHDDENNHDGPWPPQRNTYDLNSKILLIAIISLSFVTFVVISVHVYIRCVHRRRARFRSPGLTLVREPPKTGLHPTVIASLPTLIYKQQSGQENSLMECSVCLSTFEDQEITRLLPNCNHSFHAECIDKWLSSQSTCPMCRTEANPRLKPELREGPSAPTLERVSPPMISMEGTSSDGAGIQPSSPKASGSVSRLRSFRRILSRERSSRGIQYEVQEGDPAPDLERQ